MENIYQTTNNQNSTTAKSYIKVDLTDKEDVTLKINAEVSSQTSDYGYVTITNTTTAHHIAVQQEDC